MTLLKFLVQLILLLSLCFANLELVDPTTIADPITLSGTYTYRIYSNGNPNDFQFLCPSPIVTRVTLNDNSVLILENLTLGGCNLKVSSFIAKNNATIILRNVIMSGSIATSHMQHTFFELCDTTKIDMSNVRVENFSTLSTTVPLILNSASSVASAGTVVADLVYWKNNAGPFVYSSGRASINVTLTNSYFGASNPTSPILSLSNTQTFISISSTLFEDFSDQILKLSSTVTKPAIVDISNCTFNHLLSKSTTILLSSTTVQFSLRESIIKDTVSTVSFLSVTTVKENTIIEMSDVSFLNNNFGTATVISFNNGFLGSASFFRLKAVNNQCGMFLYAKGGTPPYGPMIFDTLLIQDSTFERTTAASALIYFFSPEINNLSFSNTVFKENTNKLDGGALALNDIFSNAVSIRNCTFERNTAASGGAISFNSAEEGILSFEDTLFDSNKATSNGGAIQITSYYGPTHLEFSPNVVFRNNNADQLGGAFYILYGAGVPPFSTNGLALFESNYGRLGGAFYLTNYVGPIIFNDWVFKNNQALSGGAAYLVSPDISFEGGLFEGNYANNTGSAIYSESLRHSFNNTTFFRNNADMITLSRTYTSVYPLSNPATLLLNNVIMIENQGPLFNVSKNLENGVNITNSYFEKNYGSRLLYYQDLSTNLTTYITSSVFISNEVDIIISIEANFMYYVNLITSNLIFDSNIGTLFDTQLDHASISISSSTFKKNGIFDSSQWSFRGLFQINRDSSLVVTDSQFEGNQAETLLNHQAIRTSLFFNCTFTSNTMQDALFMSDYGTLVLSNCSISNEPLSNTKCFSISRNAILSISQVRISGCPSTDNKQTILTNFYNSLTSNGILLWDLDVELCGQIGVTCDSNLGLTKLDLQGKQINGAIPSEFGNLVQLETLILSDNQLSGTLPTHLGSLLNLQRLDLSSNQLSGTLPSQFKNLNTLQELNLFSNQLSGKIPSQLESLTNLKTLKLSNNYWDCSIFNYSGFTQNNDYNFTKERCDETCSSNQCENGGTCSLWLNGNFSCQCLPQFLGTNCEFAIQCPYISKEENAEWNEALVYEEVRGTCALGYTGLIIRKCNENDQNNQIGIWGPISGFCQDVDECLTNTGECSPNANCKNVDGGFECGCKEGYSGDGFSCQKKSENNQALGIGIGVSFGLLAFISLVLLILFFLRRKKKETKNRESKHTEMVNFENISTIVAGETTLMNTKFEVSLPGFMNIDFVNQIRKEEKIGGGGAATVYKGIIIDPKLREKFGFKEVAIKQLVDGSDISLEEGKLRFEQEISIIWSISSHPHIITLVGYSENPRLIITKLYDEDLNHYIKNSKEDISSEFFLKFSKQIASGMSFVHSNGIAHRDLKPSNILLEKENGKMKAIICDFGLARISSEKNVLNQKVNVKGLSPRYTAPEVFGRMMSNVTVVSVEDEMKSDVYSYSLILWEMMTRKIPWENLIETSEIDFQVRSGKREPIPDAHGDKILEFLSALIEMCWNQIPNERPTFDQLDQKLSVSI